MKIIHERAIEVSFLYSGFGSMNKMEAKKRPG